MNRRMAQQPANQQSTTFLKNTAIMSTTKTSFTCVIKAFQQTDSETAQHSCNWLLLWIMKNILDQLHYWLSPDIGRDKTSHPPKLHFILLHFKHCKESFEEIDDLIRFSILCAVEAFAWITEEKNSRSARPKMGAPHG